MHYGNAPHVASPEDRTVVSCKCGWFSPEMTKEQFQEFGVPWYCGNCDGIATRFSTFHPRERSDAYEHLISRLPGETLDHMRDRLITVINERTLEAGYK